MGKIMVTLTDDQENFIKSLLGKYGATKSEVIRNLIIMRIGADDVRRSTKDV
jgi:hypothetical protein